jgi:hypothetical protein
MPDDPRLHLSREELADIVLAFHRHERKVLWSRIIDVVIFAIALGTLLFLVLRHI